MQVKEEVELVVHVETEAETALVSSLFETMNNASRSICIQNDRHREIVRMVVENPAAMQQALESAGFKCLTSLVVVINTRHWIGLAARIGSMLRRAGTNILYSYTAINGGLASIVFKTDNNKSALNLFHTVLAMDSDRAIQQAAAVSVSH